MSVSFRYWLDSILKLLAIKINSSREISLIISILSQYPIEKNEQLLVGRILLPLDYGNQNFYML